VFAFADQMSSGVNNNRCEVETSIRRDDNKCGESRNEVNNTRCGEDNSNNNGGNSRVKMMVVRNQSLCDIKGILKNTSRLSSQVPILSKQASQPNVLSQFNTSQQQMVKNSSFGVRNDSGIMGRLRL
jgi:hypothetical protein